MKNFIVLFLFLGFLSCSKDGPNIQNNPDEILNTSQWSVLIYYKDGVIDRRFDGYTFSFSVNTTPNCPDWLYGNCSQGGFGGHFFINDKNEFNIVLPTSFSLGDLNGAWKIISINKNILHLKRVKQEIKFIR